jgi:hypothetical protein
LSSSSSEATAVAGSVVAHDAVEDSERSGSSESVMGWV